MRGLPMALQTCSTRYYIDCDMERAERETLGTGVAAAISSRCPDREGPNEDAAAVIPLSDTQSVLVVADGFGGHPAGARASEIAVRQIEQSVCKNPDAEDSLRAAILDGFEKADAAVREMGVGAATTLVVVEIDGTHLRSYHVGDSAVLVVGQRGLVKMRSVSHSPVGYAVESGMIDEAEAMNHEQRHVVSNMVGSAEMRIEIGPALELAPRDTVLLATDGMWDNMMFDEVVEMIRKGPIEKSLSEIGRYCRDTMVQPSDDRPSKPDDLTAVAYRRKNLRRSRSTS
ncbi:MAG: protein phosphatase 2C domain-containing protein [Candidatus Latescibacterota bacterium]